jgi:hypothetical protein
MFHLLTHSVFFDFSRCLFGFFAKYYENNFGGHGTFGRLGFFK